MEIKTFEDLQVWQRSFKLAIEVYHSVQSSKEYSIKDQLIRSSLSVPSNIAEGFERSSNKEYIRFLDIAKGSGGELRTQRLFAKAIKMIGEVQAETLISESIEVNKMIGGLIKSRKTIQNKIDKTNLKGSK